MALNIRLDGDVAILSNFARLMNDPRYVDASRDVLELLDQGVRNFVLELVGIRDTGSSLLGILMTITREIRKRHGDAVVAHPSPAIEKYLAEMQMDEFWDIFPSVGEALAFYRRHDEPPETS